MGSKRKAAASDGGGGSAGSGTATQDPPKKSARRAPQPPVLIELREMGAASQVCLSDVAEIGLHEIVGVASGVVDLGDSRARIDALRMVPVSLLKRYRDAVSTLEALHESINQSPRPRLGFQLDAFDFPKGSNGQA